MNSIPKQKKDRVLPFQPREIDTICEGIVRCFDRKGANRAREVLFEMFSTLPQPEASVFKDYLQHFPPIRARQPLWDVIIEAFESKGKQAERPLPERSEPGQFKDLTRDELIDEILKRDKQIQMLREKIDRISIRSLPEKKVLNLLAQKKIRLWRNRTDKDPSNPIDFYQQNYKAVQKYMYQFILRKYDPFLIKAMDGKIAYLRKKGGTISLREIIPPKKDRKTA